MKVKATKIISGTYNLTEGKEYETINTMPSVSGGDWAEICGDLGIVFLIRIGGPCAFGEWEYVK